MGGRGNVVRNAVSTGHRKMTNSMRKTPSIGQDIEWEWKVNEVQIPGTKKALYRAFLDSLGVGCPFLQQEFHLPDIMPPKVEAFTR
jgi:hypothetical protein